MPTPTTVSTCTSETEQGTHVFHIFGYSEHRGMGWGEFVRSGAFSVGGYEWAVIFYPDGLHHETRGYISVRLELLSKDTRVRACCDLRLLDQTTGRSLPPYSVSTAMTMLDSGCVEGKLRTRTRFITPYFGDFMERGEFEASPYLQDDHLTIECVVTVRRPMVSRTEFLYGIKLPPSNIKEQLVAGQLSPDADREGEGEDVITFSVGGETFAARKEVLALRSPVFKAELYWSMSEARARQLTIEDMQPAVFRALLHFINTDSLPADVDQHHGGDDSTAAAADCEMIWHLLEAADRYAVEKLKVVCESILCKNLDAETVSTTLALASQHNCERLRDICLQYVSSPHVMDAVVATQGYKNLKTTCPSAVIEMFEKSVKLNKT